jgi:hypothetical protein
MDEKTKYEMDSLLEEIINNWGNLQQILTIAVMIENLPREHADAYIRSLRGSREGRILEHIIFSSHDMVRSVNEAIDK